MAQYIDKSALVAEIENKRKHAQAIGDIAINSSMQQFFDGMKQGCVDILSFLDTFEMKEVDLEKSIEEYFKGWTDDYDNGGAACHYQYVQVNDCKAIAKHFFELGIAVSNKVQKGE